MLEDVCVCVCARACVYVCVTFGAVELVRPVAAVLHAVTLQTSVHTAAVITDQLSRSTSHITLL